MSKRYIVKGVGVLLMLTLLAFAQQGQPPTLATAFQFSVGEYLVDSEGGSLYAFMQDSDGVSACYEQCAETWPPLTVEGEPVAGEGLDANLLGTIQRDDGATQVTYNGWPLYTYASDEGESARAGQGVGDAWFLVGTDGTPIGAEEVAGVENESGDAQGDAGPEQDNPEINTSDSDDATDAPEEDAAEDPEEGKPAGGSEDESGGAGAEQDNPESAASDSDDATDAPEEDAAEDPEEGAAGFTGLMAIGESVYHEVASPTCATCHGADGTGASAPGFVGNSRIGTPSRVVGQIVNGGHMMPAFGGQLSDRQIAGVLTYIRNSWGNDYGPVTEGEVAELK